MMKHNTKYILLASVLSLVAATGCQRENLTANTSDSNDILKFSVGFAGSGEIVLSKGATLTSEDGMVSIPLSCTVTDGIEVDLPEAAGLTKSTQINSEAEFLNEGLTSFTAAGWNADKSAFIPSSTAVSYTDGKWKTADTYRWRGNGDKVFLAYANLPSSGASVTNYVNPSVKQTFTCTVPTDARQQNDIMLGWYEGDGGGTATAAITMVHPLTAVVFKMGEIDASVTAIKSISISGVYVNGTADVTYDLSDGDIIPTYDWKAGTGADTRTGSQTVTLDPAEGATALEIADNGKIGTSFIILPQTVAEGALMLKITVVRDGEDVVLAAAIPTGTWEEGKTNTYTLGYVCPTEIHIIGTTSESVSEVSYLGGTVGVKVKSCDSGNNSPVAYTFLYCDANADSTVTANWSSTAPSWLTTALPAGGGSSTYTSADGFATAQTGQASTVTETYSSSDMLKARTVVGSSSNRRDLSMYDVFQRPTARNTANCYIVTAPGYYKFPMVYGNAIMNGAMNSSAYTVTASDSYLLKNNGALTNYNDAGISYPNILTDVSASLSDCTVELVWQEYPGLVDAIGIQTDLEDGLGFVTVDIDPDKSHIQEGNAVIALKKGNDIVWSWHIWICAPGITTYDLTYDSKTYTFMSPPLGTVCGTYNTTNSTEYPERKVYVKAVATDGTKSNTVSLVQTSHFSGISLSSGNSTAPFYQWGRKDPMVPSDGDWNVGTGHCNLKPVYDINNSISITAGKTGGVTMGAAIKNPIKFSVGANFNWISTGYVNLWNVNNSGYSENPTFTKSVYDPTPAGFRVPDVYALYAFIDSSPSWVDYSGTRTGGRKTSGGFMLYGFGYRDCSSGTPAHTGHCGRYWSCVPSNETFSYNLYFEYGAVIRGTSHRGYGYSVCPVQDQ